MENNCNSNMGMFWRGAFCGLVVGSVIAMLSTPRTGAQMRTTIKETAGKAKTKVGDLRHRSEQKPEEVQSSQEV